MAPISDAITAEFEKERAKIVPGQTGQAAVTVTLTGVEAGLATTLAIPTHPMVEGWAGREWKGSGWQAGARLHWNW